MTESSYINNLIRFRFSLRPKSFFVKNFSSYKDFQEFSILRKFQEYSPFSHAGLTHKCPIRAIVL